MPQKGEDEASRGKGRGQLSESVCLLRPQDLMASRITNHGGVCREDGHVGGLLGWQHLHCFFGCTVLFCSQSAPLGSEKCADKLVLSDTWGTLKVADQQQDHAPHLGVLVRMHVQ